MVKTRLVFNFKLHTHVLRKWEATRVICLNTRLEQRGANNNHLLLETDDTNVGVMYLSGIQHLYHINNESTKLFWIVSDNLAGITTVPIYPESLTNCLAQSNGQKRSLSTRDSGEQINTVVEG